MSVVVEELVVRYGDLVAVDHLSWSAAPGSVTALLGPNGAGKSSTVEVAEGYRPAAAGHVRVLGLDPIRQHSELVARMGVMLQRPSVYPGMRVGEAAEVFCAYYGRRREASELISLVGLTARVRSTFKQLSGGEQQRLSLALALAGRPEVLFLDEPTAAVDVAGRQLVRQLIRRCADEGACVVLCTHELDEAERLADHVVIIDHGHLVAQGSPSELMSSAPADRIAFGAPTGLDVAALGAAMGAACTQISPGEYEVMAAPTPANVATLTAWLATHDLPLADLRAGRQRLEDVFVRLTAGSTDGPATPARRRGRRR